MNKLLPIVSIPIIIGILVLVNGASALADLPTFVKTNFNNPLSITNPYMPLQAGTTYIYDGTEDKRSTHEEFVVTDQTKSILGVNTRVIHDTNWVAGKLEEDTFDWFAQDNSGNVWYFGEDSSQYKNGKVIGHEGSWEAGVDNAAPGIVMESHPKVDDTFQQEFAPGIAQDMSTVLSLTESICVPYGCFSHLLETKDFSPLEPGITEHKYFAQGVGQIETIMVEGGSEESHLVSITH